MLYIGTIATGAAAEIYSAPFPTPGIPSSGNSASIEFVRVVNESGSAQTFTLYVTIGSNTVPLTPVDTQLPIGALWDDLPVFQIPAGATLSAVASATGVKFSVNSVI